MVFFLFSVLASVLPGSEDYLLGRQAEKGLRYGDALAAYERCASQGGPLEAYARARQAACRAESGDEQGAIAAYERVLEDFGDGPWVQMVQTELAELRTEAGDLAGARECFEHILKPELTPWWFERYQWTAAESLASEPDTARQAYGFWRRMLEDPGYRGRRYDAAERLAKSVEPADRWLAAESMVRFGAVKSAQPLLALLSFSASGEDLPRLRYLEGRVLLGTGKAAEGRILLEQVANDYRETPWAPLALSHLVRSYSVGKDSRLLTPFLDRLLKEYPESAEAGDTLWWLAGQYREAGKLEQALAEYERLAQVIPSHERADDALLAVGETCRATKSTKRALMAFDTLVKQFPSSSLRSQAAYWSGRIRESSVDKAEAIASYREAASGAFGDYYGSRALARLHDLDKKDKAARDVMTVPGTRLKVGLFRVPDGDAGTDAEQACSLDQLARLRFFGQHGLPEGEWEALYLACRKEAGPGASALYATMADAGLGHTAVQVIDMLKWGLEEGRPSPARLRVMYPRAYWDEVERVSKDVGLDPYLVLAVARQESTFRASVSSSAGACGVMQLMPKTAEWLAAKDPMVPVECASNLEDPASSLRLGACYLARMLRENNGNLVYALAAYNAGPGNLRKWLRTHGVQDAEQFVETIPLSETRNYVKRVLGNYAAYRSLYRETPERTAR